MNRLDLNFTINSSLQRKNFVDTYLNNIDFVPTSSELETIADYILYGRNEEEDEFAPAGKSLVDSNYIFIEVKNSPWSKKRPESLDAILDMSLETGNPAELQYGLIQGQPQRNYRVRKETFSRKETRDILSKSDPRLLEEYEDLWKRIDDTDYIVTKYALIHGRRKLPIREELLNRIDPERQTRLNDQAAALSAFHWAKLRRYLVELRQQQYIMRDSFVPTIGRPRRFSGALTAPYILDILPLGGLSTYSTTLFPKDLRTLIEADAQELVQRHLHDSSVVEGGFDFRNADHIATLIYTYKDLEYSAAEDDLEMNEFIVSLGETLLYYITTSNLDKIHLEIILMKSKGDTNDVIRNYVNKKYGRTYSSNYISTIFRKKCCEGIADAAKRHVKILNTYAESGKAGFKQCNVCQRWLLRDAEDFVRKARSRDGLSSRCKRCDRNARKERKETNKE